MIEIWRSVVDFEGYYEVSNKGRVKRIAPAPHTHPGRIVKPSPVGGYLVVHLSAKGVEAYRKVHQLVMVSFVGLPPRGHVVNHKNGIKVDNRWPENLEYLTGLANHQHAALNGLLAHGSKHPHAKLTEKDIIAIRASTELGTDLARRFGVNKQSISMIRLRHSWRHVT